ncbi:hypothetical protein [Candidatus Flexifilum breve]|uniref:hypothetical protein n=1 Tax=Candidatus Flexifilum breve TaxID=3140694 RepID=UPI0031CC96FB
MTTILGIESSCDETAAAVVTDGKVIALEYHRVANRSRMPKYGGVFPEIASRAHIEAIGRGRERHR